MYEGLWVEIAGTVLVIVSTLLAFGLRKFSKWLIQKVDANDAQKEALQALLEGMAKAQDEIVREAKKASEDGKLTKDEINKAKDMAWTHAKAVAVGPAKDIVINWTSERVSSYIKQFLAKTKKSS